MANLYIKRLLFNCLATVALTFSSYCTAWAAAPSAWVPVPGKSVIMHVLSNNGKWAASETQGDEDTDNPQAVGGMLIDMETRNTIAINGGVTGLATIGDVTDDGEIVVGGCDGVIAYWTRSTAKWTKLSMPKGYNCGQLLAVTPDGRYAVGYAGTTTDINVALPVMYDLTTNESIALPNMPMKGMNGRNYNENCPCAISPDGRYIVGMVAQSYMMDDGVSIMWAYVYDRTNATFKPIGFNCDDAGKFTSIYPGGNFIDFVKVSPNGEWVTGVIRLIKPISGSNFGDEYGVAFRYNIPSDSFEVFDNQSDKDVGGFAIDDNGIVYGALPWESPYPVAQVRQGKYFYSFDQIFKDVYNFSIEQYTGDEVTGRPMVVSGDGLTMTLAYSLYDTYALQLTEPLNEAAKGVNLLGNYTSNPPSGSQIAKIKSTEIVFDRAIAFIGDYKKIKVLKSDGSTLLTALSANVSNDNTNKLTIGLRTTTLTPDETYTLVIPAGLISIAGDNTIKNQEIKITYKGRSNTAVKANEIYPADNGYVNRLDASANPVVLVFDSQLALVADAPAAKLYEDGISVPRADFSAAISGNLLYLFPLSTQYLFDGLDYTVEIPAGIVTDLSGSGANEAVTLHYHGMYVREVNSDEIYIFKANGSTDAYLQFITYDGDLKEPAPTPAEWGFTSATPWWGVMSSNESGDLAFASHSMYSPAAKSDDWLMTPQLYIPDENVYLSFDVQGYLKSKADVLKVYIYVSDDGYNSMNASLASEIRENGTLVYNKVADPGLSEEGLDGEWTHEIISLKDYADQAIYIAFVNENENQSAIFLDNVQVVRNVKFTTAFKHASTLVGKESVKIEGVLTIKDEVDTYSSVEMNLKNDDGKTVDTFSASGLNLVNGSTVQFSFNKELPLTIGTVNKFSIDVRLDGGEPTVITDAVKDLVFRPTKRVVLEEFTGSECGNCPLGILAIDKLLAKYPSNFIPITLRCYSGDFLGAGVTGYAAFLGLEVAPSAMINRSGSILSPAISANGEYFFSGEGLVSTDGSNLCTWMDAVAEELQTDAEGDIDFEVQYDATNRSLTIPVEIRYALDTFGAPIKLLAVILEDNLLTYQVNYFSTVDNATLLPWTKGGNYGQGTVLYTFDDVARGVIGQTYSGTPGLLPIEIKGGETYNAVITGNLPASIADDKVGQSKVVVMMIDDMTQRVINANICKIGEKTGSVESVVADAENIEISIVGNTITAEITNSDSISVQVYNMAGMLISSARGSGSVSVDVDGISGPVIVKAATSSAVSVRKAIIQ